MFSCRLDYTRLRKSALVGILFSGNRKSVVIRRAWRQMAQADSADFIDVKWRTSELQFARFRGHWWLANFILSSSSLQLPYIISDSPRFLCA